MNDIKLQQDPIVTLHGSGVVDVNWNAIRYQPGYNVRHIPIADPWVVNQITTIPVPKENSMQSTVICYTTDTKFTQASSLHKYIERNTDSQIVLVTNWQELVVQIGYTKPTAIVFHAVEVEPQRSYHEFVGNIERLCMRLPKKINIGAMVECDDTADLVNELQSCNITGIVPHPEQFGIDATVEAVKNIMVSHPHWPNDIIACLQMKGHRKKNKTTRNQKRIQQQNTDAAIVSALALDAAIQADSTTLPLATTPADTSNSKPRHLYFREDHRTPVTPELAEIYKQVMPIDIHYVIGWENLDSALAMNPKYLSFNISTIIHGSISLPQMMTMIKTRLKLFNLNIPIAVGVNKDTPLFYISELKSLGVHGIMPTNEFGLEETLLAAQALITGVRYWPEHIISQLPSSSTRFAENNNIPHVVYFRDDHSTSAACTGDLSARLNCTWDLPSTWNELSHSLEAGHRTLATHIRMIEQSGSSVTEFVNMITSMVRFMPNSDQLRIGVVIEKSTHIKIIKEMQRTSINGVLLDVTNFNIEEVSEALNHLTAGKSYWPKHILAQLPGNRPTAANTNAIKLTARQEQIATLICQRGLSNKKVANMLTITESTVKAHVSAILKAYGVRNRTQLVLSAVKDHRV